MANFNIEQIKTILEQFDIGGVKSCQPYGNGHINNTFLVVCEDENGMVRYILQSINGSVFPEPRKVIENIEKVTAFLGQKISNSRELLSLMPTVDGEHCYFDSEGRCWRMYNFIEDSLCLENPENADDFYQCAVAFGRFQRDLADFSAEELHETIADFHNTPKRYNDFLKAVDEDRLGRAAGVSEEIEFIKARKDFFSLLYDYHRRGELPLRVTHNDTKSNNVMLDASTRKALCVIDLDTIMPGFSVTDFGDAIRFGASTAAEDETDLSKVTLDLDLFSAYVEGYIEGCGGLIAKNEILLLPEGSKMMTIECGMRFLTDYLNGDTYFKIKYPEHNLVRCRTQLKLVYEMEKNWDEMKKIVEKNI